MGSSPGSTAIPPRAPRAVVGIRTEPAAAEAQLKMGSSTLWRYRRTEDESFQLEPAVVADSWYFARKQAQVILDCESPHVEDTGIEPPPPEVIPAARSKSRAALDPRLWRKRARILKKVRKPKHQARPRSKK